MPKPRVYEDPVVLSIRMPKALRESLRAEAAAQALSLNAWVYRRLNASVVKPEAGNVVPLKAFPDGRVEGPVVPSGATAEIEHVAERDQRHRSPGAMPVKTDLTSGYSVVEADCPHPKAAWKVFSYMTKCTACGRRMR